MLTCLERSAAVLYVEASGKLTHADYQRLIPLLEKLIHEHGKIRVLFELEECRGWDAAAAWDDLAFGVRHGGDVERCAVVGNKKWQEWMSKLSRPFFNVKYFDKSELDRAWQWLEEERPERSTHEPTPKHRFGILSGLTNCQHG
jgi:SpoIIAA-like